MEEIKGIARVKFHPGKVEEWKRLTEEAMGIVRTRDSGTPPVRSDSEFRSVPGDEGILR